MSQPRVGRHCRAYELQVFRCQPPGRSSIKWTLKNGKALLFSSLFRHFFLHFRSFPNHSTTIKTSCDGIKHEALDNLRTSRCSWSSSSSSKPKYRTRAGSKSTYLSPKLSRCQLVYIGFEGQRQMDGQSFKRRFSGQLREGRKRLLED